MVSADTAFTTSRIRCAPKGKALQRDIKRRCCFVPSACYSEVAAWCEPTLQQVVAALMMGGLLSSSMTTIIVCMPCAAHISRRLSLGQAQFGAAIFTRKWV